MSAIAKPCVFFAGSTNPNNVVGVEHINTIEKQDIPALPNTPASSARYNIVIGYQYPNGYTKNTTVQYLVQATRDTAFTTFKTLIAASI